MYFRNDTTPPMTRAWRVSAGLMMVSFFAFFSSFMLSGELESSSAAGLFARPDHEFIDFFEFGKRR
jgi:hypothetical protein